MVRTMRAELPQTLMGTRTWIRQSTKASVKVPTVGWFNAAVTEILAAVVEQAADTAGNSTTKKYFATGEEDFDPKIYGLAQCVPDLAPEQCRQCLRSLHNYSKLEYMGKSPRWVATRSIWCSVWYSVQPFYVGRAMLQLSAVAPPPPPPPANPPVVTPEPKADNSLFQGVLSDGQEIAVKKLLGRTGHGLDQLHNEVLLLAELQHKNLVRLQGFCLHQEETLLVYEYIKNGSLDNVLFGNFPSHSAVQSSESYGYMPPEYLANGSVSTKIDIFSFGVLVLEIVTRRSNCSSDAHDSINLLSDVWNCWIKGTVSEMIDQSLDEHSKSQARRCIQIGLLCVQRDPQNRPHISSVIFMLTRETMDLQKPAQPAFFFGRESASSSPSSGQRSYVYDRSGLPGISANGVTLTEVYPR
ncbi:hypothetical protein ABZP36_001059 [Zizania latifolia]